MDPKRELMRHCVAALAYRAAQALRGTPETLATFRACESSMTCGEILTHMTSLIDWTCRMAIGEERGAKPEAAGWREEIGRFYTALERFDNHLASDLPMAVSEEKLLQGPVSDALSHVGQLATMRRMAGVPMGRQNYFKADVRPGEIAAMREFPLGADHPHAETV